jgi:hypothetical protein
MNIELHIDTLVLRGIGRGQEQAIRAAMERELTVLLASDATAALRPANLHQLVVGSVQVNPRADAAAIGAQLAGSIYRGILR